jgi:hypothetical protein
MNEILRELEKSRFKNMMYIIGVLIWLYSLINKSLDGLNFALALIVMSPGLTFRVKLDRITELEEENRRLENIVERSSDE